MSSLYMHVPPVGRHLLLGLEYDPERPARHCRICGITYQPQLARASNYPTDMEVQYKVEILLQEWAINHNKKHSANAHESFRRSGRFLSPEATEKLVPLGIIPVGDMVSSDEAEHAARLAPRAPKNDVEGSRY